MYSNLSFLAGELLSLPSHLIEIGAGQHNTLRWAINTGLDLLFTQN